MINHANDLIIRPILESDNNAVADLIREVLREHRADKPGTAFADSNLNRLFQTFRQPGAAYFVAEDSTGIVGGGGIYPTPDLPAGYCELVKLYLHRSARGRGTGFKLISTCFTVARDAGYSHMYLETMPELSNAIAFYENLGFKQLTHALGQSGHFNCNIWMLCEINKSIRQ